MMRVEEFRSKVDWWVPAVVAFTAAVCFIGPLIDGELLWLGAALAAVFCGFEIAMFASVKYRIRGNELGIRNWLYGWEWFPIDKISEAKPTTGILSAPALSVHRVSIRFSDKRILKSSMPLEISPADRERFIARLREINPAIAG